MGKNYVPVMYRNAWKKAVWVWMRPGAGKGLTKRPKHGVCQNAYLHIWKIQATKSLTLHRHLMYKKAMLSFTGPTEAGDMLPSVSVKTRMESRLSMPIMILIITFPTGPWDIKPVSFLCKMGYRHRRYNRILSKTAKRSQSLPQLMQQQLIIPQMVQRQPRTLLYIKDLLL